MESDIRGYAIAGIEAEIKRLNEMRDALISGAQTRRKFTIAEPATVASDKPRRRELTAAQRKAVSKRMKAYWAARRKG